MEYVPRLKTKYNTEIVENLKKNYEKNTQNMIKNKKMEL